MEKQKLPNATAVLILGIASNGFLIYFMDKCRYRQMS